MATELKPAEIRAWTAFLDAQAALLRQLEAELVEKEDMTLAKKGAPHPRSLPGGFLPADRHQHDFHRAPGDRGGSPPAHYLGRVGDRYLRAGDHLTPDDVRSIGRPDLDQASLCSWLCRFYPWRLCQRAQPKLWMAPCRPSGAGARGRHDVFGCCRDRYARFPSV